MKTYGGRRYDSIHIYLWYQVEVTLEGGKQDQVLTGQEAGWERERDRFEAIWKKFSLPCPESNPNSLINQPFTLLLLCLSQSVHTVSRHQEL